ncbi:ATP-binding protein [Gemmatimonas sp.]|uniref:ATP-binding protein n=1 Tax=Gemmatimonas sp. TaxID=1962908 RepID=UPI003F6F3F0E
MHDTPRGPHGHDEPRGGEAPGDDDAQRLDPLGADDGEHLSLRFFDGAPDDLAEHLALPLVDGLDLDGRVRNALDHAVTTRRGAVVIGAKGCGKSVALARAVAWLEHQEYQREQRNDAYARRAVHYVPSFAARRYHEGLTVLCRQILGVSFHPSVRGGRKQEDDLRTELLLACRDQNIVALVIDEGERVAPEGLRLLRDLMAEAEWHGAHGAAVAGAKRAVGLGVLLVGTPTLRAPIMATNEAAQRWSLLIDVDRLFVHEATDILLAWFPAWRAGVARDALSGLIERWLVEAGGVPWRTLENVARLYFRYVQRNHRAVARFTRETTPWNERLFVYVAQQVRWKPSDPNGDAGGAR